MLTVIFLVSSGLMAGLPVAAQVKTLALNPGVSILSKSIRLLNPPRRSSNFSGQGMPEPCKKSSARLWNVALSPATEAIAASSPTGECKNDTWSLILSYPVIAEVHIKVKNAFAPPEKFFTTLRVTITRLPMKVGEISYCIEFEPILAGKTETLSKTSYFRVRWRLSPDNSCIKHFRSIGFV